MGSEGRAVQSEKRPDSEDAAGTAEILRSQLSDFGPISADAGQCTASWSRSHTAVYDLEKALEKEGAWRWQVTSLARQHHKAAFIQATFEVERA